MSGTHQDWTMIGTGRVNKTGGSATVTMPSDVVEMLELESGGKTVVWFRDGKRLFAVPKSEVSVK